MDHVACEIINHKGGAEGRLLRDAPAVNPSIPGMLGKSFWGGSRQGKEHAGSSTAGQEALQPGHPGLTMGLQLVP